MKTRLLFFALSCALVPFAAGQSAPSTDPADFPYVISVALGSTEFAAGDNITITSLRGNRPHLETGGRYQLEGTYTLASADAGRIGWSITTRGDVGGTPVERTSNQDVAKGSGTFRLTKTFTAEGWPHVSFNVYGLRHGGVYFGEQGVEGTVLRNKSWSDFDRKDPPAAASRPTAPRPGVDRSLAGNRALMEYLGDPVPLPANLDARYTGDGVTAAFRKVCKELGYDFVSLAVDDSEFPCIVYGVFTSRPDGSKIVAALNKEPGYAYAGAVSGGTPFAYNITPYDQYPPGSAEMARRRVMIRMQMLQARVKP